MKDENKTKAQLISELNHLRQKITKIENSEILIDTEIIESIPHPFYVIDANNYTIKLANSAARQHFQTGKTTCYALTHNRDVPCGGAEHLCPLEEVKKTKKTVKVEHIHYDKNGNTIYVEVHGFPIFDKNGKLVELIEFCLDITERKNAEKELHLIKDNLQELVDRRTSELTESEDRYRTIFEQAADAIIIFDPETEKILWFNRKAHENLGYSYEEFKQLELRDFQIIKQPEHVTNNLVNKIRVDSEFYETKYRTKDGFILDVQISTRPIIIKGRTYCQSLIRDITEYKR